MRADYLRSTLDATNANRTTALIQQVWRTASARGFTQQTVRSLMAKYFDTERITDLDQHDLRWLINHLTNLQ